MRTSRFSIPAVIALPVGAARLRRRFHTAAVVVVALVQLTVGAAHAETTTLAPPYASDQESCSGNVTCEAAADAATGDLRVNAAAAGSTTQTSTANAAAKVVAVHTLGTEADAINYTANFDVLEGVAQTAGFASLFSAPLRAAVRFVAWAQHRDCAECFAPQIVEECIATTFIGADYCTVPSGRLPLSFAVTNTGGGPVPAGTVEISAQLQAVVSTGSCLGTAVCEASASGRATVTNIAATWNNLPVAVDDAASSRVGFPVTINVLANDSDRDGDPLTVTAVSDPPNGSAVINADNTVTYDPDGCFTGTDTFTYTISDGQGGTDTALVSVRLRKTTRPTTRC